MFHRLNILVVDGVKTSNNTLNIYCNADGFYNIQVVGTRDDPMMEEEYLNNPVEYIPK